MNTITVTQQTIPYTDAVDFASPLLNAAANLETRVRDAERRVELQAQQLRRADDYRWQTRQWLKALKYSLRTECHFRTSQLLKRAIADLVTNEWS